MDPSLETDDQEWTGDLTISRATTPASMDSFGAVIPLISTERYRRSLDALTVRFGNASCGGLNDIQLIEVMRVGDFFVRSDAATFLQSFGLGRERSGFWRSAALTTPNLEGQIPPVDSFCQIYQCAEALQQRSVINSTRLRVARTLPYQYFKKLCDTAGPEVHERRGRGRATPTIVIDQILSGLYSGISRLETGQKRSREALRTHRKIGKKWSALVHCAGFGILLIYSERFCSAMKQSKFTQGMAEALIFYLCIAHPQGIRLYQLLSDESKQIIRGGSVLYPWPALDKRYAVEEYTQDKTVQYAEYREEWVHPISFLSDWFQ
ncbi:hypothetical protein EJ08DRAFT_703527 [Tothia fuscella]|uniref:Uncharacterized protein n=1 Tax=Tothia fuscella TaxID=1048955 RepID=A0A9P4TRJ3_9PEZI|nr:hypothetical protein EJ08DRAFT_703527 [Tothia fuscella]